ncbi:hypothetical protein HZU75_06890 [Chitinibacter fontanus]|uniref:Uncharacterized protein n=1 Tax=Chitinibacter fontanus TaxID=1737446 RepID=A0A7D5V9Q1_9NEIS|nr:hypothetical protein [Chitinibacter fontanus]QLI81272.1 hypothetical protein HZU75_06890 [Chitinibacter fontanus]
MGKVSRIGLFLALIMFGAIAQAFELSRTDLPERVKRGDFTLPMVLLGTDVEVYEFSASGAITIMREDTQQAQTAVTQAVDQYFAARPNNKLIKLDDLSAAEKSEIKEYFALFDVVSRSSQQVFAAGWEERRQHYDYTLGSGLPWLKQKTGSRYALVVSGLDLVSSGGRVAMAFLGAAVGIGIPMGQSYTSLGIADLDNGDIVWLSRDNSGFSDLKHAETTKQRYKQQLDQILGK